MFKKEIFGENVAERPLKERSGSRGIVIKDNRMVAEWVSLSEAFGVFSRHEDFHDVWEEKRGAYLREYTALCALFGS